MEKENNYGIIVVIIIVLFLFFLSTFIYYKINIEKKEDNKTVDLESEKEELVVDDSVYSLMNTIVGGKYEEGFNNAIDKRYNYDFNEVESKKVSNFDNDMLSSIIYYYALNNGYLKQSNNTYTISEDNVKKIYLKIFGSNLEYKVIKENTTCPTLTYDSNKKIYTYNTDCGTNTDITKYNKIIDVDEDDDALKVTEEVAYYTSELEKDNVFITYQDAINKTNSIGTISESTEVQIQNLKDYISKYRYTFKKENDKYYLYSVERTR